LADHNAFAGCQAYQAPGRAHPKALTETQQQAGTEVLLALGADFAHGRVRGRMRSRKGLVRVMAPSAPALVS